MKEGSLISRVKHLLKLFNDTTGKEKTHVSYMTFNMMVIYTVETKSCQKSR